jgi:cytochrome P450
MVLHPEVQRKGQREIGALTKFGQLLTFEDAETCPYITAVVYEVLRWNAVFPLGEYQLTTQLHGVFYTALTSALSMTDLHRCNSRG